MRFFFGLLRSGLNILVLISALVLTPLLALSHFSIGVAGLLGSFADNYLPRPTLLTAEKRSRVQAQERLREQRVLEARERGAKRRAVTAVNELAGRKGKRILIRGAGALAVGWLPVVGVAADVASLSADYADICALFATIDKLSALLYMPEASLYRENYCDVPEQGIEMIMETARNTHFPWEDESMNTSQPTQ
jgi:hypothetical protein